MTLRARGPALHSRAISDRALRRGDELVARRIAALDEQSERPCGHGSEYDVECPRCAEAIFAADAEVSRG